MRIGELNQTDLHDQLKYHYCGTTGQTEVDVDGFVVDVLLPTEIVEIQTRNLGKIQRKLTELSRQHKVRLVHPVAAITHLVKTSEDGSLLSSRLSPRRGRLESAFREVSAVAPLLRRRNMTLEIALVEVTEFRRDDGKGSWRRRGVSITGRKLDRIIETHVFRGVRDFRKLIPDSAPAAFTNSDMSDLTGLRYALVQPITNTLRKMGVIEIIGKRGNSLLYERTW